MERRIAKKNAALAVVSHVSATDMRKFYRKHNITGQCSFNMTFVSHNEGLHSKHLSIFQSSSTVYHPNLLETNANQTPP